MAANAHSPRFMLREPHPGDLHALSSAEQRCFVDPWPSQFFAAELMAPGRFQRIIVDDNGVMVAYLFTAWQYLDLHVLKVATLPEQRRSGLARRLMKVAEQHTAQMGGEAITLEVRPSNEDAIALYRSLGYESKGERPGYYANGESALVMTKILTQQPPYGFSAR